MGQKRNLKGDEKLKALCIKVCRMVLKHIQKFIALNDFFFFKACSQVGSVLLYIINNIFHSEIRMPNITHQPTRHLCSKTKLGLSCIRFPKVRTDWLDPKSDGIDLSCFVLRTKCFTWTISFTLHNNLQGQYINILTLSMRRQKLREIQ